MTENAQSLGRDRHQLQPESAGRIRRIDSEITRRARQGLAGNFTLLR